MSAVILEFSGMNYIFIQRTLQIQSLAVIVIWKDIHWSNCIVMVTNSIHGVTLGLYETR